MDRKKEDDNKRNVLPYRRRLRINIGIVVFAFVLVYFLIYLFQYLTQTHVSIYEVESGQIMVTTDYTGLILRSEEVTYSDQTGKINYYSKEGEKAGYGDLICSIDTEGSISAEITAAGLDGSSLTKSDLINVQEMITDFSGNFSGDQFYTVYSFGQNLNSEVQENLYLTALDNMGNLEDSQTFFMVTAARDGVLAFYTDGYENVTPETFSADMYQAADYIKTNLSGNTSVSSGQALYKMITDEDWYMLVPLDQEQAAIYQSQMKKNEDSFLIRVTFKKDDAQTYATAQLTTYGDQDFLLLSFNSSMIRYVSERYLEVELGSGDNTGLKIPNSAITQKEFLVVPAEYITSDSETSGEGVVKIVTDKQGDQYEEFVSPDMYYIDEETGDYCIVSDDLSIGDTLMDVDSGIRYIVNETVEHDGVYNLNKGYAVFKLIEPITSNEDYTIVQTGTSYGLTLYDRIALDGSSISEGEFAN